MMDYQDKTYWGIYVFEGIDNVGKTTIIQMLKKKIDELAECDCVVIAFPGNEPRTLGSLVYDIHHHQDEYFEVPINETSLQLLHIASHIDLIQRMIRQLSSLHCIVLLDRFWWSTYVYGLAGELGENIVQAILAPELMCWTDINVKRIFLIERQDRERDYEIEKDSKIVSLYRELAQNESKCTIVKNDKCLEETVTKIFDSIMGA